MKYMGEFSIFHWLVLLVIVGGVFFLVPYVAYRHGRKVGDQQGYIRGYKEGQASNK